MADTKAGVRGNYADAGIDNWYLRPGRHVAFRQFITNTGWKAGHLLEFQCIFGIRRMLIFYFPQCSLTQRSQNVSAP